MIFSKYKMTIDQNLLFRFKCNKRYNLFLFFNNTTHLKSEDYYLYKTASPYEITENGKA